MNDGKRPTFDAFAEDYDAALERGISVSGENKDFFARGRVEWLKRRLPQLGIMPAHVLDFGCGTGTATPYLLEILGASTVRGVDPSAKSIHVARRVFGSDRARFHTFEEDERTAPVDVAYCNGVFHHIPLDQRDAAVAYVFHALRPGGVFAFCENNPWNPGTQLVMARIPFDREAIKVSPPVGRALLRKGGFEVVGTDALFFFPGFLKALRPLEPSLAWLPLGAQYMILARKPAH